MIEIQESLSRAAVVELALLVWTFAYGKVSRSDRAWLGRVPWYRMTVDAYVHVRSAQYTVEQGIDTHRVQLRSVKRQCMLLVRNHRPESHCPALPKLVMHFVVLCYVDSRVQSIMLHLAAWV